MTIDYGNNTNGTTNTVDTLDLSELDLNNLFERSGKILGGDLHSEYWKSHAIREHEEVKTEIIVLVNEIAAMERLEVYADNLFNDLYDANQTAFRKLKDDRKNVYKKLAMTSTIPKFLPWELPQTIDFVVGEDAHIFENHLFIPIENEKFKVCLNPWEYGVIKEELSNGILAWLRNLDRKKWSLEIPYETGGMIKPMFPDLLVVRINDHGYVFDILEPHDPSRNDNCPKAVGLAKFAEKHGEYFGRIQLIRELQKFGQDIFYRLDMGKLNVRNKVRSAKTNDELDRIFNDEAESKQG